MVKAQEVLKCVGTLTSGDYGKQGYSYCQPCIPRQTFDTVRKEELYGAGNDSLEAEELVEWLRENENSHEFLTVNAGSV